MMAETDREAKADQALDPPRASGLAIASIILGALSLVCCGFFTAVPGIVCGHMAASQERQDGGKTSAVTLAGLITNYAGLVLGILAIVIFILLYPLLRNYLGLLT
jgi:hypothetical protein